MMFVYIRGFQGKDERSDAVAERSEVNPTVQQCFCLLRQGFVRERRSKAKRLRQSRLKNSLLYTLITWPHWHLISSFLLVEPLIIHSPRGAVATSYAYDFQTTVEAL